MLVEQLNNKFLNNNLLRSNRKTLLFLVKLIIATGLLFYLIHSVNFSEIVYAVENANLIYILLAVLLLIPNIYLQQSKWRITSNLLLDINDNKKIWLSLFYGLSAGVFTPARVGEYFGRAIIFKEKSLLTVTLATLLDKIYLLIIVTFYGAISSLLFINYLYNLSAYLFAALFIVIFIIFYLIFVLIFLPGIWNKFLNKERKHSNKLEGLVEKLQIFCSIDKIYSTKMLILSMLLYLCFLLQYALLVTAFSNHPHILEYIWAATLVMFVKTVIPPISIGELGIREGASVYFITQFYESASTGFNASIFLFLINVLLPALIGLFLLMKKNDD